MSRLLEALVRVAARSAPSVSEPPAEPRSIFVLRNNDVGDLLVVTPLFEALRRRFPAAHLAAGVGSWNLDVLRHNPHLREVMTVNAPWFNKYQAAERPWAQLAYIQKSPEVKAIAERRFEVGIDVLGSVWGSLLLLAARIPFRMGVRGYAGGHSAVQIALPFDPELHVGRAALRCAEALGATELPQCRPQIFLAEEERVRAERWWASGAAGVRARRLIVGPGGGLAAKRWPAGRFAALVRRLPPELSVLVLGGPGEKTLVSEVATPACRTFGEPPGLREVFALVAAADLVVCNSSMLLHVAAAFGKPAVVTLGESFASARQHQAQWGYPGLSRSLGKETGERAEISDPDAVLSAVAEELLR